MVTVPPRNRPHTVLSAETTFPQSSRVTPDTPAQHTVLYTNAKPASTYEHVHASLGHPGLAGMAWHRKHTPGANYTDADANAIRGLCQGCVYGGMRQASTDHTRTHRPKPTRPGQQFSLDAFTCVHKSRDNIICCDILTDHFTRERYPIFTRDRSAAELCLKTSILFNLHTEWMSGQIDRFIQYDSDVIVDPIDVRFIRVDAESNYKSREFFALAASLRYTLERTPPRDKHANGIAERSVGLVTLKTNVIMLTPTPKVPVSFWPEAMAYACDTLSFNLVKTLNTSPYTLLHNAPVPLAYLQPFWTPCFVYLGQKKLAGKVGHPRACKARMVGYSYTSTLERVYKVVPVGVNGSYGKVRISKDVIFDLNINFRLPIQITDPTATDFERLVPPTPPPTPPTSSTPLPTPLPMLPLSIPADPDPQRPLTTDAPPEPDHDPTAPDNSEFYPYVEHLDEAGNPLYWYQLADHDPAKMIEILQAFHHVLVMPSFDKRIPRSFVKAMLDPLWRKAILIEIGKFSKNEALVPYINQHLVPMMWLFAIKTDGTYKARLVGRGDLMIPGIDFDPDAVYCGNVCACSIKMCLCIAAKYKLTMRGGDLEGAYLVTRANHDFPVFIKTPQGYED